MEFRILITSQESQHVEYVYSKRLVYILKAFKLKYEVYDLAMNIKFKDLRRKLYLKGRLAKVNGNISLPQLFRRRANNSFKHPQGAKTRKEEVQGSHGEYDFIGDYLKVQFMVDNQLFKSFLEHKICAHYRLISRGNNSAGIYKQPIFAYFEGAKECLECFSHSSPWGDLVLFAYPTCSESKLSHLLMECLQEKHIPYILVDIHNYLSSSTSQSLIIKLGLKERMQRLREESEGHPFIYMHGREVRLTAFLQAVKFPNLLLDALDRLRCNLCLEIISTHNKDKEKDKDKDKSKNTPQPPLCERCAARNYDLKSFSLANFDSFNTGEKCGEIRGGNKENVTDDIGVGVNAGVERTFGSGSRPSIAPIYPSQNTRKGKKGKMFRHKYSISAVNLKGLQSTK